MSFMSGVSVQVSRNIFSAVILQSRNMLFDVMCTNFSKQRTQLPEAARRPSAAARE